MQRLLPLAVALGILGCLSHSGFAAQAPAAEQDSSSSSDDREFKGLTSDEFQQRFDEYAAKGYRAVDVRGFAVGRQARYDLTMGHRKGGGAWRGRHDMTTAQFRRENGQAERDGYELTVHSSFRVGRETRHAAIWEKRPRVFLGDDPLPATGAAPAGLGGIDEMMETFLRKNDIPGAALAITREGRLVYARGFGYADLDAKEAVQPDSLFRIASLSKPITAVAVFKLIESGRLSLDDRAFELLDLQPAADAPVNPQLSQITIRQLLQHTAGFDDKASFDPMFHTLNFATELRIRPPTTPDDVVRAMLHRPPDFSPGERFAYSNYGYCVLGRVIEAVSGESYADYVQDEVLQPLGITRMQLGGSRLRDRADGEVHYYTRSDEQGESVFRRGQQVPVQYGGWCLEAMDAHGGWIASASDLARFASALYYGGPEQILSNDSIHDMFAPPTPTVSRDADGKAEPYYYGCGWTVWPLGSRGFNASHVGGLPGSSTLLVRRYDGLTWAVLFNCDETPEGKTPATLIDGQIHAAVNRISSWPGE